MFLQFPAATAKCKCHPQPAAATATEATAAKAAATASSPPRTSKKAVRTATTATFFSSKAAATAKTTAPATTGDQFCQSDFGIAAFGGFRCGRFAAPWHALLFMASKGRRRTADRTGAAADFIKKKSTLKAGFVKQLNRPMVIGRFLYTNPHNARRSQ